VADSGRGLAREHARGTRKPLGTQRGAVGLGEGLAPTWAARQWWRNAGERGWAPRVRFTRRTLAQQKGETKRRLTRLGNGPWRDTTAQAARFGGEVGT